MLERYTTRLQEHQSGGPGPASCFPQCRPQPHLLRWTVWTGGGSPSCRLSDKEGSQLFCQNCIKHHGQWWNWSDKWSDVLHLEDLLTYQFLECLSLEPTEKISLVIFPTASMHDVADHSKAAWEIIHEFLTVCHGHLPELHRNIDDIFMGTDVRHRGFVQSDLRHNVWQVRLPYQILSPRLHAPSGRLNDRISPLVSPLECSSCHRCAGYTLQI